MIKELDKQYDAAKYEDDIYREWEDSGFFNPDKMVEAGLIDKDAQPYTIVLPPPNITDKLHLGHASMIAIEGLLIRFHRMRGYKTLWVPGTDHAAIATQNVVEKRLVKEGKTRHDLGREKFLEEVDKFIVVTQETILKQIRKMGASLDWDRLAFTLDEQRQKAVSQMFLDMYEDEIIYRGERVVNWCPRCQSTLADDEVEYKVQQNVKLYTFKYGPDFPISISTTRPETKLGDTAVAVNPSDPRYKKYIGKEYEVDFVGVALKIKIIADREVDMEYGTGALGVTPAHSMVDYQMSLKNNLALIKVIDENANIRDGFGKYSGKSVKTAREMVVTSLKEAGLIESEVEIENNLSICYRCDHAIEPLPSQQWFVDVNKKLEKLGGKSLKEKAIEAVVEKEVSFVPDRFEKIYKNWMDNLHDWCISRQIWFGHRIPVWYNKDKVYVGTEVPAGDGWTQDPDTLDTWFSSGMWTFSTLGWPDKSSKDLQNFNPTQVLETGFEILTLWVSRMIMMSYYAVGTKPFSTVYLHGMILDDKGKKMSKSKGNGIDPLDVIPKFGTDAIRLSLLLGNTAGNNLKLSEEKIGQFRNFVNKLWNVSRYILQTVDQVDDREINIDNLSDADLWILHKLQKLVEEIELKIGEYNFSLAGESLKDFIEDWADWHIEATKFDNSTEKGAVLLYILRTVLKLGHPFMPFVTEVIWKEFNESMLMVEKWPENMSDKNYLDLLVKKSDNFEIIKTIITEIRRARSENKVEPVQKVKALIYAHDNLQLIQQNEILIKSLKTGIGELEVLKDGQEITNEIKIVSGEIVIYLLGAIDKEKESKRIAKEIENLEKLIVNIESKLANKDFVKRAPAEIVALEKERLDKVKKELQQLSN